jgi:hypothetical protein
MPLGQALDELTRIYPDTEWEWRKYGFLVVRGPMNPMRDTKERVRYGGPTNRNARP